MSTQRGEWDWDSAWWGLILLTMGAVFLLINTGVLDRSMYGKWWTVLPVVFGVMRLITGRTAKALSEGVFLVVIGGWFMAAVTHWNGLTWRNSWPLALIAVGASSLTETIAGYFLPKRDKGEKGVKEGPTCIL